jgi:hypothetical protein
MTPRSIISLLAASAAFVASADAALIAQFNSVFVTPGADNIPAADYADHLTVTDLAPSHDDIDRVGGAANYDGWGSTVDATRYVGFKISVDAGYQLNLTDLAFRSAATVSPLVTSYVWGMRVDNGSGFGAWSFGKTYTSADADFALIGFQNVKSWDFADITVTGTVEFGIFATASDPSHMIEIIRSNSTIVNGTVTQVPEPSAALLGFVGCLACLRRRR